VFHNGGDPNGGVYDIHWRGWGRPVARGRGLNPIFLPGGGYYGRPASVLLRAQRIGTCRHGTGPAYTQLFIRFPQWPGGPRGPWQAWSGAKEICDQTTEYTAKFRGACGHAGRYPHAVGSVFGIVAYRVRCRTARRVAGAMARAGCGAAGCRRTVAGLHCRLQRHHPYESSTPWGHHPIVRLACTRGSANFTGWLVRSSRTSMSAHERFWVRARLEEDGGRRAGRGVPARARFRARGV
jgi:hypothetical protein